MAVTQYKCTICKRVRDILDSDKSLTITTSCTITQGCRGSLVVVTRLPYTTRENTTPVEDNLTDWQQRNVLWNHEQRIASTKWRIAHALNVPFVVDVLVRDGTGTHELSHDQFDIDLTEQNLVTLTFLVPQRGMAQLIARNGSKRRVYRNIDEDQIVQVSQSGRLVIFDATTSIQSGIATYSVELVTPDGTVYEGNQNVTSDGLQRTSWNTNSILFNDITQMRVLTLSIGDIFITPAIGTIPDGSRLNITKVFGRDIQRHEILLGLSRTVEKISPFNRAKDLAVDVSTLSGGIIIRQGEAYVYQSDVEKISPPIRVLENL